VRNARTVSDEEGTRDYAAEVMEVTSKTGPRRKMIESMTSLTFAPRNPYDDRAADGVHPCSHSARLVCGDLLEHHDYETNLRLREGQLMNPQLRVPIDLPFLLSHNLCRN
jgi:hypothetical protein